MREAADVWRSNGADVKIDTVLVGEIGNLVFTAGWDNLCAYGKSPNKLVGKQSIARNPNLSHPRLVRSRSCCMAFATQPKRGLT